MKKFLNSTITTNILLILVVFLLFVATGLLQQIADNTSNSYTLSSIQSDVSSIQSDISSIESDVSSIRIWQKR